MCEVYDRAYDIPHTTNIGSHSHSSSLYLIVSLFEAKCMWEEKPALQKKQHNGKINNYGIYIF